MKDEKIIKIDGERFFVDLNEKGSIQRIVFQEELFEPPMKYTLYEVNGEVADISEAISKGELSLKLTTKAVSGRLTISSGKEIKIHFEPDKKDITKNVSIVISFPLETEFHLPEGYNLGRQIDDDMPVGEMYSTPLGYNFFLASSKGMWLRFATKQSRFRNANLQISRHPEVFIVTFTWNVTGDASIAVFPSMDEALSDFEAWLSKELRIRKRRDDPTLPGWVHNVKLVLIMDMMRSNWEIAHDYDDIANLAKELKKIGCPKDTLFYIPGWNGAYDSTYPAYQPHPELGGEGKFREMMENLHENGFRVMIHTNAWGLDPCHPNIDKYEKYVCRDDEGYCQGWQIGRRIQAWGIMAPASRPLKFLTDKVPMQEAKGARFFTFETVYVPDTCEALFTVGNLGVGDMRVKFTIDHRSMSTPPGWFKTHIEYDFPFPFLLKPGANRVHIEVMGDIEPDWSESWYKIRYSFIPLNAYISWTYPILLADMNNPEWIKIFVDEVATVVRKYNIDAVHVDATEYYHSKPILDALKERLPEIAMGGEGIGSLEDLGYWTFCQNARQSLLGYLDVMRGTRQQGSLPDTSEIEELYSWLDKPSQVCSFVKDYIYIYPHLCAADSFVPIGKVCNVFPTRFSPRCIKELWRVTRDARRLDYIPGLRLNYRKYGLDEETKKAIREIARA